MVGGRRTGEEERTTTNKAAKKCGTGEKLGSRDVGFHIKMQGKRNLSGALCPMFLRPFLQEKISYFMHLLCQKSDWHDGSSYPSSLLAKPKQLNFVCSCCSVKESKSSTNNILFFNESFSLSEPPE